MLIFSVCQCVLALLADGCVYLVDMSSIDALQKFRYCHGSRQCIYIAATNHLLQCFWMGNSIGHCCRQLHHIQLRLCDWKSVLVGHVIITEICGHHSSPRYVGLQHHCISLGHSSHFVEINIWSTRPSIIVVFRVAGIRMGLSIGCFSDRLGDSELFLRHFGVLARGMLACSSLSFELN